MEQMKKCCRCEKILPANKLYFYSASNTKDKLHSACKECEKTNFQKPKIQAKEGYKICTQCNRELPMTKEYFHVLSANKNGFCSECKKCKKKRWEKDKEIVSNYRKQQRRNIDLRKHVLEREKLYRERTKDARKKYIEINKSRIKDSWSKGGKKYRQKNKEKIALQNSLYRISHKENYAIYSQIRRNRKLNNIVNFNNNDWNECKNYFNNKCSYCGESLLEITQDHIVPVSKGGHYIKQNIITACKSCNSSKNNSDMEIWYRKQPFFNQERLDKIHQWMGVENNIQQLKII